MRRIQLIIKVTNGCNLRCKYCYNAAKEFKHEVISLDKVEKMFGLVADFDQVDVIFHGGEPMLASKDFYTKVLELEKKVSVQTGVKFSNQIQTNATLLDSQWANYFKKNHISVGISFDGIYNDAYRGKTEDTLKAVDILKKNNMQFGCIAVVADKDYNIESNYEYMKRVGVNVDFSYVFIEGNAKTIEVLPVESYVKQMTDLFDKWIYDKDGIPVRNFNYILNKIFRCGSEYCCNGSCIGNFFCLDVSGDIFGCSRESVHQYCFGNVNSVNSMSDVLNSDGFKRYITGAITRRKSCAEKCELFDYCKGGCSDDATTNGDISKQNPRYCFFFKTLFNHIKSKVDEIFDEKPDLSTLNPHFRKTLIQSASTPEEDNI